MRPCLTEESDRELHLSGGSLSYVMPVVTNAALFNEQPHGAHTVVVGWN